MYRQTIRVFISSPGDVEQEREGARRAIQSLQRNYSHVDLKAVLWEDLALPATASFQETIDLLLEREPIDIAVFILWSRLGSPIGVSIGRPDGTRYRSGTEREFDLMLAAYEQSGQERPVMLAYVRDDDTSFREKLTECPTTQLEELIQQRRLAEKFIREQFQDSEGRNARAYHTYREPVGFVERLRLHLRQSIDELLNDTSSVSWSEDPYRGLEVYDVQHATIFHGRDEETCELLQKMRDQDRNGCAFVVIVGASGSGKSSLARAGVAANLIAHGGEDGIARWHSSTFTPSLSTNNLFGELARCVAETVNLVEDDTQLDNIAAGLAENPSLTVQLSIAPAFHKACAEEGGSIRLLCILDQLEELWTDRRFTSEDRERFLKAIEALAQSGYVTVLATIRSDFYPHAQQMPEFMRLKGEYGHYDLLPPDAPSLERLITEPARLAGLSFERDQQTGRSLSKLILQDAARDPTSLPLLQYTLAELHRARDDERHLLTFAAYERLGGVEGALAKRADESFRSLPVKTQKALAEILPLLVAIDPAGEQEAVRRRATVESLTCTAERSEVVEHLVTARFLTMDRQGETPVASLAHEALLRRWSRIVDWISANREHLRRRSRVEQAQQRWLQQGGDESLLLSEGLPLDEGKRLLDEAPHLLADPAVDYIRASIAYQQEAVRKGIHRRRLVLSTVFVLLVAGILGTSLMWRQASLAARRASQAERDARESESEAVAAEQKAMRDRDRARDAEAKALKEAEIAIAVREFVVSDLFYSEDLKHEPDLPLRVALERASKRMDRRFAEHPDIAAAIQKAIGAGFNSLGQYSAAERFLRLTITHTRDRLGREHPDYGESLTQLGLVYQRMGDFARAEPLLTEARAIFADALGSNSVQYARSLIHLAHLYDDVNEFARAVPLYQEALDLLRAKTGSQSLDYCLGLLLLAQSNISQGDYESADSQITEARNRVKETLGESHPLFTACLLQGASLYTDVGDFPRAEVLFAEAKLLQKELIGEQHPDYGLTLRKYGDLYRRSGAMERAEALLLEAESQLRGLLSPDHTEYASVLHSLGLVHLAKGDLESAEKSLLRARDIRAKNLGESHFDYAETLHALGLVHLQTTPAEALVVLREALLVAESSLKNASTVQSERQQELFARKLRPYLDGYLQAALETGTGGEDAFDACLRWNAALVSRKRQYRRLSENPQAANVQSELRRVRNEIRNLTGVVNGVDRDLMNSLQQKQDELERRLSSLVATDRRTWAAVTSSELRSLLPESVSFVLYQDIELAGKSSNSAEQAHDPVRRHLVAFCLNKATGVEMIRLGSAEAFHREPNAPISVIHHDTGGIDSSRMRRLLWNPIEPHLEQTAIVLVGTCPSLTGLSFAALPGRADGTYLIEDYAIAYLPIPEVLFAESTARGTPTHQVLAMGDVDFGSSPAKVINGQEVQAVRGQPGLVNWSRLPATVEELSVLQKLYRQTHLDGKVTVVKGKDASEENFRRLSAKCNLLHMATHGFSATLRYSDSQSGMDLHGLRNVSGIVLAGANRLAKADDRSVGTDDGILWDDEVSTLPLDEIDLAVLAVCESTGMQQAFHIAGAQTVISTFWKVGDHPTQKLMADFYRNLWQNKMSKVEALRQAQLAMIKSSQQKPAETRGLSRKRVKVERNPASQLVPGFDWAAFVLSGDWR